MRLFHVAIILVPLLHAGCNTSGDADKPAADAARPATQTGANVELVKLNLPGMT